MGTTVIVGVLAAVLRERSDRLIDRLGEAARTDPLTGLLNRRGFQEVIEGRFGSQLALIFADLDHFKALNDRFGHHVGDDVLRRCGQLLSTSTPPGAAAARTGGEEFAIVLPGWTSAQAYELAEALRRTMREVIAPGGRGLTLSLGVASSPEHATSLEDLMRAADKALYLGKQLGRVRSVIFSAEAHAADQLRPGQAALHEQAAAVLVLAEALDMRDGGTGAHSRTVGRYAELTARQLGLPEDRVERIRLAGVLHDIGKLGVSDQILRKPGPLSPLEWQEITKHPELGARILTGAGLDDIAAWVIAHHERLDGEGYPFGVRGESIPLEARILAVTDAYEAMTSDRVYRAARSHSDAAAELTRCAGSQFDPDAVEALLAAIELPEQDALRDSGYQPVS
jgi:diguanylate cyclase (GGDEF)-like protein/putative nucleotidyltransferase with HDIG domain